MSNVGSGGETAVVMTSTFRIRLADRRGAHGYRDDGYRTATASEQARARHTEPERDLRAPALIMGTPSPGRASSASRAHIPVLRAVLDRGLGLPKKTLIPRTHVAPR